MRKALIILLISLSSSAFAQGERHLRGEDENGEMGFIEASDFVHFPNSIDVGTPTGGSGGFEIFAEGSRIMNVGTTDFTAETNVSIGTDTGVQMINNQFGSPSGGVGDWELIRDGTVIGNVTATALQLYTHMDIRADNIGTRASGGDWNLERAGSPIVKIISTGLEVLLDMHITRTSIGTDSSGGDWTLERNATTVATIKASEVEVDGFLDINSSTTSTFVGDIQSDGELDIDGSGESTFVGNIQSDGLLNIDGLGTNALDGSLQLGNGKQLTIFNEFKIDGNEIGSTADVDVDLKRNSVIIATLDNARLDVPSGIELEVDGTLDVNGTSDFNDDVVFGNGATIDSNDVGTQTWDGTFDVNGAGPHTFGGDIQSDGELDIDGTGDSTMAGDLDIAGGLAIGSTAPTTGAGLIYLYREAGAGPYFITGKASTERGRIHWPAVDSVQLIEAGTATVRVDIDTSTGDVQMDGLLSVGGSSDTIEYTSLDVHSYRSNNTITESLGTSDTSIEIGSGEVAQWRLPPIGHNTTVDAIVVGMDPFPDGGAGTENVTFTLYSQPTTNRALTFETSDVHSIASSAAAAEWELDCSSEQFLGTEGYEFRITAGSSFVGLDVFTISVRYEQRNY